MDTNAVVVVIREPFGLDDRRDILGESALQGVWQNFLSTPLSDALPFAALPAFGLNGEVRPAPRRTAARTRSSAGRWRRGFRFQRRTSRAGLVADVIRYPDLTPGSGSGSHADDAGPPHDRTGNGAGPVLARRSRNGKGSGKAHQVRSGNNDWRIEKCLDALGWDDAFQ
jgi:hypothetical protein